ncbi:MAG: hypothetical protein K0S33_3718 [Bacteroidetes bacterium]|jgi:hypothetical protein|nr:hypothetical protein [Bacteroidota bacterium]
MSKTPKKKIRHTRFLRMLLDDKNSMLLKHVLSPLQLAGFEQGFQAFTYNLNGVQLEIEGLPAWELLTSARNNIRFLRQRLFDTRLEELYKDENARKFLRRPVSVANLPKRLYNIFWAKDCFVMADVARYGVHDFDLTGIGKSNREWLFALFGKNGCGGLYNYKPSKKKKSKS